MNQFNFAISRKRRLIAGLVAVLGIAQISLGALSDKLMGAAVVAFSIELAFIPGPPLNLRLGEVYALARSGWRAPWSAKLLGAAGFVFLVSGLYLKWQGR